MAFWLVPFICLFACRMARGHKEASTSQAGRKRRTPRETPTASSLVGVMSVEHLRSFKQVPTSIRLEMADGATTSTMGATDNAVYFTREQFVTGLCLPIPSLVKQFLYFTRAPLALIHSNVFRILMGCSVLKFLYQLDIFLVEIWFIYTLKLGIRGHLSMSAHNPGYNLQSGSQAPPRLKRKGLFWLKVRGIRRQAL